MYEDLPLFSEWIAKWVIVIELKFFILKLSEFASLFTAMACVNVVFPPQKINSNETLQLDAGEFLLLNFFGFCCAIHGKNVQPERT